MESGIRCPRCLSPANPLRIPPEGNFQTRSRKSFRAEEAWPDGSAMEAVSQPKLRAEICLICGYTRWRTGDGAFPSQVRR
ncbi:MAG: hypothetical protein DWQ01_06720 [Planctomycetota bacterium]|nr:MAG: hypothetical protein DWQ01_06720 [Planctomycetota bacterium]